MYIVFVSSIAMYFVCVLLSKNSRRRFNILSTLQRWCEYVK